MSIFYDEDNFEDTDYSQLDISDYKFNTKFVGNNESNKREKKLLEEIALLRKMLRYHYMFM